MTYCSNVCIKSLESSIFDDIPNLGSVITLDNKGRLINSQFSKPSSSQTLLKLNSSEEIPDADDLPYSVISYGDTPNTINLPYNDHNYVGVLSNKNFENYDKKASEYSNKQQSIQQYSNRSNNFPISTNLRISHFSNYNNTNNNNNNSNNTNCLTQSDFINSNRSVGDNLFFNDSAMKLKSNIINNNSNLLTNNNHNNSNITNQFGFSQNMGAITPLIAANKSTINNNNINSNHNQSNGFFAKKQVLSNAIVINSSSMNCKLKGMSVIKLQRSSFDGGGGGGGIIGEPRIINVPMQTIKKPSLTSIIANESAMPGDISGGAADKSDKTFNLIPRCVCGFIHDDGGMIRCEICQTWQHIICMYPDNKFPILYKCENCEPREIDSNRAILTQTNYLRKVGQNPNDFLVNREYGNYEPENISENIIQKTHTPQYVIVQPELKTPYRQHIHDSIHGNPNQIYITNSKDSQLVPPGSPRTSKRKQDLISLKTVLTKSNGNSTPGSITVNNILIHSGNNIINNTNISNNINTINNNCNNNNTNNLNNNMSNNISFNNINLNKNHELQKTVLIDNQINYNYLSNYHIIPTSSINPAIQIEQREPFLNPIEMSAKLKSIFSNNKLQSHTNMTLAQEQYLRQHCYSINNINFTWEVIRIQYNQYNQHVIRSLTELNCNEIIMEYNGFVSLTEDYNKEFDFRKHYNPFVLFYDKFDHLSLCIDAKNINSESKYIRRSCTPNAEVKHRLISNGQIRFYITPINRISKEMEITIGFDFNYMKCRYPVECACNQPSCELLYRRTEEARSKKATTTPASIIEYEPGLFSGDNIKNLSLITKPHKKRGRAAKILNSSNRQLMDRSLAMDINNSTLVRRNKRGRPPLNRPNGMQRSDIFVKASSESSSNNCLAELKEPSDNESMQYRSNENLHPNISMHSNFKNFKRIPSSHWSLKAHRKLCASITKSSKSSKKYMQQKVGRPIKYKKGKLVLIKKEIELSSDPASSPERYNGPEKPFDLDTQNNSSNEEYDADNYQYSNDMKHQDMSREEEGKYWLEEINNKIYKQKLKEAKKVKRKNRIEKKSSRKLTHSKIVNNQFSEPEIKVEERNNEIEIELPQNECQDDGSVSQEEIDNKSPTSPSETTKDKRNSTQIKSKRGRKCLKSNKNYIVSYKTSNIDDLKNDLMLISACLEEEPEEEPKPEPQPEPEPEVVVCEKDKIKEESVVIETSTVVETPNEAVSDSLEQKKLPVSMESDIRPKQIDSSDEKQPISFKSKYRKSVSNNNKDGSKDCSKASREERWVNIMWQRILKNESCDSKSKRKRNKSSFAEESNPSEENQADCNDLSSPKFGDSDFCDDNLSSDTKDIDTNYKPITSTAYKTKRKTNKLKSSSFTDSDKHLPPEKHQHLKHGSEHSSETRTENSTSLINEDSENKLSEQSNEQCGLIVYKEQQSNPMEKFSRENSAKLFNENIGDGFNISSGSATSHPPHAKKRWLSQALLEENLNEACESPPKPDVTINDAFTEKLSVIESGSKHSFLPPVITSIDNSSFSLTPQKVAMNPKKRLLNQFSMEDNAFKISSDIFEFKSGTVDQEQSKTKLTLSEYRKRRYSDKLCGSNTDDMTKKSVKSCDDNLNWEGLNEKSCSPRKNDNTTSSGDNFKYLEAIKNLSIITDSSFIPKDKVTMNEDSSNCTTAPPLSYLNTLNNLKMPSNLDPRLTKPTKLLTALNINKMNVESKAEFNENALSYTTVQESCTRSPSKSSPSNCDWKGINPNERGPRTPSDIDEVSNHRQRNDDCLSTCAPSLGSVDSFESQPSPTSDSHFDLEKSDSVLKEIRKNSTSQSDLYLSTDWMNHSITIAKVAGIPHPDLLQEIEEFDDEYVPLPENLPERSKEEMETLLLTQKRDSQIREWQEVKQLEREKVKLEHQVRSMQRRMQRCANKNVQIDLRLLPPSFSSHNNNNSNINTSNRSSATVLHDVSADHNHSFPLSTIADDEKTMKTFSVQLSNFNDRLIQQINIVKNNRKSSNPDLSSRSRPATADEHTDNPNTESELSNSRRKHPIKIEKSVINCQSQKRRNQCSIPDEPTSSLAASAAPAPLSAVANQSSCSNIDSGGGGGPTDAVPFSLVPPDSSASSSSISDHLSNFKPPLFPEMTPAFM